nr:MAG TPA: RecT protein [Caudoviricetes sp.]
MENMIQNAAAANVNKMATKQKKAPSSIQDYIEVMKPAIKAALPSVMTPERFSRITLSALSANPTLKECTPQSFLGAMMTAAQLGLEPNTPLQQAFLIPFRNHGKLECSFQLGYKGLIDLAYRSGEVSIIQAHTVYENDEFQYELGLDPKLRHVPAKTDRGAPISYYAMFKTKDGGYGFQVMSIEEVRAHAKKFSKSYGNGPWVTNFDEMAKKTVLKKVLKYAPLKSDFVRGIAMDETTKTDISSDMSEIPDMTEYVDVDHETGEVIDASSTSEQP